MCFFHFRLQKNSSRHAAVSYCAELYQARTGTADPTGTANVALTGDLELNLSWIHLGYSIHKPDSNPNLLPLPSIQPDPCNPR